MKNTVESVADELFGSMCSHVNGKIGAYECMRCVKLALEIACRLVLEERDFERTAADKVAELAKQIAVGKKGITRSDVETAVKAYEAAKGGVQ